MFTLIKIIMGVFEWRHKSSFYLQVEHWSVLTLIKIIMGVFEWRHESSFYLQVEHLQSKIGESTWELQQFPLRSL